MTPACTSPRAWHKACDPAGMMDGQNERDTREQEPFMETNEEDPAAAVEQGEPYFPPTDPVVREGDEQAEILGGFAETAMDDREAPARSRSGGPADEAIADAVRRELRRDASTEALELEVSVDQAIVTLRGQVSDLADSDDALAVAGRVPGVVDVVDEIEIGAGAER